MMHKTRRGLEPRAAQVEIVIAVYLIRRHSRAVGYVPERSAPLGCRPLSRLVSLAKGASCEKTVRWQSPISG
jgi:hypothetical protein